MAHPSTARRLRQTLLAIHSFLLIIWFALPFSPISATRELQSERIQNELRAGSRVTTVHPYGSTIDNPIGEKPDDHQLSKRRNWSAYIFQWQLKQRGPNDNITLHLGDSKGSGTLPDMGAKIDLTSLALRSPCFVKDKAIQTWMAAGDQDWVFAPVPYVSYADATLLFRQSQRSGKNVRLRLLVPHTGTVQIWKDMPGWDGFDATDIERIDDTDEKGGLIASFTLELANTTLETNASTVPKLPRPRLEDVQINLYDAMLPTRTYWLQSWVLVFLMPLFYALELMYHLVLHPASLVLIGGLKVLTWLAPLYLLFVLLSWLLLGRESSFRDFTRSFWMTRYLACRILDPSRPRVWGPYGPLDGGDRVKELEDADTSRIRAKALAGPVDFFKSSSPLDDLLFTFKATRWMVKPLRWNPEGGGIIKYHRGSVRFPSAKDG